MKLEIDISGGVASALTSDASLLEADGETTTRRYSHIWPSSFPLRCCFRSLRAACGEEGRVSEWTRAWRCRWQVRLADEPRVVRFESRSRLACVDWELENLQATL